ncbi:hypothetical protein [Streptomyces antibioticus]|uniref:Uncharacterized protein n=1 Tax=Streptomyces antibioticus TaxID=1890 RepID=A0AAE6Y4W6_STRAT|nr:hypothetical protein [Streptomyces antibioticus]MCX5166624.1 hypothetical protein [Streptomyces antibioticus]OOQ54665.1 hypothetical protein AFM16_00980 [Streptomyces antibioticus]QIT42299.1 hypothetical protein HCX60_01135 [Streptomyces antibioticus]
MRSPSRNKLDLIVFIAVLGVGVLLLALGVSANSLATVSVALSGLYGAWTGTRPTAAPRSREQDQERR